MTLEEKLAKVGEGIDDIQRERREWRAEVLRLRAALQEIIAESSPDTAYSWCQAHLKRCNEIAQSALGSTSSP